MNHLLRGAGSVNPNQGVELVRNREGEEEVVHPKGNLTSSYGLEGEAEPEEASFEDVGESEQWARVDWSITQLAAREIELSYAGGCNAALGPGRTGLEDLRPIRHPPLLKGGQGLEGMNVFVILGLEDIQEGAEALLHAIKRDPKTRAVVVCKPSEEGAWRAPFRGEFRVTRVIEPSSAL